MRESEFEFIRNLVYQRSRICLDVDKREMVTARLGKRLRATNLGTVTEYCNLLQSPQAGEELSHLIDAISTNHTFFFRESAHFDFVRDRIVPEMRQRQRAEHWPRFLAWSAACSSGEEPYSLAITLQEAMIPGWDWHIHCTDISHRILQRANQAIYAQDVVDRMPSAVVRKYFQKGVGPQEGNFRVRAELKQRLSFAQLNLLESDPPVSEPFHVIFCRNVMIYFDRPTQEELVRRLARRLVPGGYLLVGHSESLTGINHSLEAVRPATYRRPPTS
ncbi:MAG TPA: protein-glutamate O-methyltransferase [Lacunisphaera sp.]|nr:protein-glutamate O-methyltransferase [Lacunisphaera sp.]